jgi:hypothetical protein
MTQSEKLKNNEVKKKSADYKLLQINPSKGSKMFVGDNEVENVKDADMLRKQDTK